LPIRRPFNFARDLIRVRSAAQFNAEKIRHLEVELEQGRSVAVSRHAELRTEWIGSCCRTAAGRHGIRTNLRKIIRKQRLPVYSELHIGGDMADAAETLKYDAHARLDLGKVNEEINQAWSNALQDPQVLSQLKANGIDASTLPQTGTQVIGVEKEGENLTPDEIKIIVTIVTSFAPVVATIVKDLWANKILPRIRAKQGEDSIKKEKNNEDPKA
jgi:hypothetical protein